MTSPGPNTPGPDTTAPAPGPRTPGSPAAGPIGTLQCVVLDCPDVLELATFYQRLLGGEINRPDPQWAVGDSWATLHGASGAPVLAFQGVADHRPPVWGAPEQQFHIDVRVADLDAAHDAVIALGAWRLDAATDDENRAWRIYADPAGHPFCLVRH
ncbi:VOC family protein [Streptomyces roseoviridis]|uniref:VOC family protein n=1 Tax=Streptomyces roseoviridis TaxID=67361 RepID=A0ABV5QTZ7_9ACTN